MEQVGVTTLVISRLWETKGIKERVESLQRRVILEKYPTAQDFESTSLFCRDQHHDEDGEVIWPRKPHYHTALTASAVTEGI